jgi:ATP-dependent RNA helicase RhlE
MSFATLGLAEEIVRAVREQGYTEPTPVQLQAIPAVLTGGDLLAGAQTGTGKTAGFVLPVLQLLSTRAPRHAGNGRAPIRALILTPTRELAAQVEESVRNYGRHLPLTSMAIFGGVGVNPQVERLKRRLDILVATPGRLLDHVDQRTIDLSRVEILVLDEADRMLDMGFIRDIRRVLAVLPRQRQNLLFSATYTPEIKALADGLLNRPATIEVAFRTATADLIQQKVYRVDRERKRELLTHLIREHRWFQVLVFTRTKHGANKLAEQLEKAGIAALAIHGNKSQNARTRALAEFKDGTLQVLVATDIAARGLDIADLPHVVNYELPNVPEDYVHRIGRTGRAGAQGEAISLVCVDEAKFLADIEKLTKRTIPSETIRGFEPDPRIRAEAISMGGQRGPRDGRNAGGGRNAGTGHGAGSGRSAAAGREQARPAPRATAAPKPAGGRGGRTQQAPRPRGAGNGGNRPQGRDGR